MSREARGGKVRAIVSLIVPALLSTFALEACKGKDDVNESRAAKDAASEIEIEVAIPLTAEQAALLHGVRASTVSVSSGTVQLSGASRGEIVAGVRAGVRAGIRAGGRAASSRRAAADGKKADDNSLTFRTWVGVPPGVDVGGHVLSAKVLPESNPNAPLLEVVVPVPPRTPEKSSDKPEAAASTAHWERLCIFHC